MYKEYEILSWAEDKGILKSADRLTQALKTVEEVAELISHTLKGGEIADDIGDIYVTIVIQAELNDINMLKCIKAYQQNEYQDYEELSIKELLATIVLSSALICVDVQENIGSEYNTLAESIGVIYTILQHIAGREDLLFDSCVDLAYNEIAGRTGEMVDGVFRKD